MVTSILVLPNGRRLSYAESGDPSGPPVFYCHGWPACRLEAALIEGLPVRLIAPDRPGFGGSDAKHGRRLLDFPSDLAKLADHLGIDMFHIVGVSGGAPYALACAAVLERVAGVALVSPLPPLCRANGLSDAVLGESLRRLRALGEHPRLGAAVIAAVRFGVRLGLFDPQKVLEKASAARDAACLTPALRVRLVAAWHEGLRQGAAGAASDSRLYASDWGFAFSDVHVPVSIWHGTADKVVPAATCSAYETLPAEWHSLPDEGHYSVALDYSARILGELVGEKWK